MQLTSIFEGLPWLPRLPPRPSSLLALPALILTALSLFAGQQAYLDLSQSPAAIENKHVRAVRLSVPAHAAVSIRRLAYESVLVSLRDAVLQMTPEKGSPQRWEATPGSLLWVRGNFGFSLANTGNAAADLVSVELRDSYAFDQLSVPRTVYDPLTLDPRHFRVALENEHLRALLLHFGRREESPEAQFSQGLSIPLTDVHVSHVSPKDEHSGGSSDAGAVSWEQDGLYSIHNLDVEPFDSLYIELKHPFCYKTGMDLFSYPADQRAFFLSVLDKVEKIWRKTMPREAKNAERGLVRVDWKIQKDGSMREDDMLVSSAFASSVLIQAARKAIRSAAPFPALPSSVETPEVELRYGFLYNLPRYPTGCN